MKAALTYYDDMTDEKEEYALIIGMTIIDTFQSGGVDAITLIPFDKTDYLKWLGNQTDTPSRRAAWSAYKLGSMPVEEN